MVPSPHGLDFGLCGLVNMAWARPWPRAIEVALVLHHLHGFSEVHEEDDPVSAIWVELRGVYRE